MAEVTYTDKEMLQFAIDNTTAMILQSIYQTQLPRWLDIFTAYNPQSMYYRQPYPILNGSHRLRKKSDGEGHHTTTINPEPIVVENDPYAGSIEIDKRTLMSAPEVIKGQIAPVAQESVLHWISLVLNLLNNGESILARDGKNYFANDHILGKQSGQSNTTTTDISEVPANLHGNPTSPSAEELFAAAIESISTLMKIRSDGTDNYINQLHTEFHLLIPISYSQAASKAFESDRIADNLEKFLHQTSNTSGIVFESGTSFKITYTAHPGLTYTDKFITAVADTPQKPLIRQSEGDVGEELMVFGPDSDHYKNNGTVKWLHEVVRGADTMYWEKCCLNQLV